MPVLIEAISVVVRVDAVERKYPGGWPSFAASAPNQTLCADGELARIGFMNPSDVQAYVDALAQHGILYQVDGAARDVVVVDQIRGPVLTCPWIEFGHLNLEGDPKQRVAACRLSGSKSNKVATPDGWVFARSLTSSYGFVPSEHQDKSLNFVRRQDGLDVYLNELTGEEVFVGRATASDRQG